MTNWTNEIAAWEENLENMVYTEEEKFYTEEEF